MPIDSNGSSLKVETNFNGEIVSQDKFIHDTYQLNSQSEPVETSGTHNMLTRRLPKPKARTVQRTEKTPGAQARKEIDDAKKLQKAQKKDLHNRNIKPK